MPPPAKVFEQAVQLHQQGNLAQAEKLYRQILQADSRHTGALHLLGVIAYQVGKHDDAVDLIRKALRLRPNLADAYNSLGAVYRAQNKLAEAETALRKSLQFKPDFAEAHGNLGNALRLLGKLEESRASLERAVRLRPDYADAHSNLGLTLKELKRPAEAEVSFRQALRSKPDHVDALMHVGMICAEKKQPEEALRCFRRVLQLNPTHVEALDNLGKLLATHDRFDDAMNCFREALRLKPDSAEVHHNLGNVLLELRQYDNALASFAEALRLKPTLARTHSSRGNTLRILGRLDEARASLQHALRLDPGLAEAYSNLGNVHSDASRMAEAVAAYDDAIRLDPELADARLNRALALLMQGMFEEGWSQYEWRWKLKGRTMPSFSQPLWDGEPLGGRTVLIHAEQGLGDTVQFVRCTRLVKERGGVVVFHCPRRLIPLLRSFPGIDRLASADEPPPPFDVHCPLASLPRIFGITVTTVPGPVPYLFADPQVVERWRARLASLDGFTVGISWQGNPKFPHDRQRSTALASFEPLARIPGVRLVSLQKGVGCEQVAQLAGRFAVTDWTAELDEATGPFLDTAALMTALDLVVSVDTAPVHLAGALGVRTWLTQCFAAYWTWMREREDSPWYPTVRIFRQPRPGDWASVFERVAAELTQLVASRPRPGPPVP